jgi:DNA invertase Pin-like site-specific DNA recombinase
MMLGANMNAAAIYARKSTGQRVAMDAKSVTRQIENGRKFATQKGWTVADAHVFVDDGISGAEFEHRPGFTQMRNALTPKAPFQFLIVSEQKSIGREMSETAYVIKQFAEAGVEIFEYMGGTSLTPKNWMDKTMSAIRSAADEAHREDTSKRVHEVHARLAEKGHVTGGRVFGYRNKHIFKGEDQHGNPLRSHVEREIDSKEAAVVQRIFALYDSGLGLKRTAKLLTSEQALAPKPFRRKDGIVHVGWSAETIRAILRREIYHGVVVWNRSRKRTETWGKKQQQRRPKSEWLRTPVESLRIVPEDLWVRVASRRADGEKRTLRFASGRLSGRPPKTPSQNLLAGLATCGVCGGALIVETSSRKRGRIPEYICGNHRRNGSCDNALRIATPVVNEAVLQAIEEHALTPATVEQVVSLSEREDHAEQQRALLREQATLGKRVARLVAAIETGGEASSLMSRIHELETRQVTIVEELASVRPIPRVPTDIIENRLAEWRRLLRASTTQGRAVLQRVLAGRITFTPIGGSYEFKAATRFAKLFAGMAMPRPKWLRDGDIRGTEHLTPEDTFDADYGRLLDGAGGYGKRDTSPTGLAPKLVALLTGRLAA